MRHLLFKNIATDTLLFNSQLLKFYHIIVQFSYKWSQLFAPRGDTYIENAYPARTAPQNQYPHWHKSWETSNLTGIEFQPKYVYPLTFNGPKVQKSTISSFVKGWKTVGTSSKHQTAEFSVTYQDVDWSVRIWAVHGSVSPDTVVWDRAAVHHGIFEQSADTSVANACVSELPIPHPHSHLEERY